MQQNPCLSFPPRSQILLKVLFFYNLLHSCAGQHELISSHQPIVAGVGDDIMLPCHLEPVMDVAAKTLEWIRPDLNNIFVYVWRSGQEFVKAKHPSYTGRTSLFTDELKHGNMSLKLSEVKLSDKGKYKCFIPELRTQSIVEVVVLDVAAIPVISFSGVDKSSSGVVLQCESKGWYPEPEVLWLDGEGNVLSAGPTETVRGPDDLYTVSSRVTVDKSNNITCRVQQNNIHQTRETHIHVTDDFFVQSSILPLTVGLAVGLAVGILSVLSFALFLWKKQNINSKRNQQDEMDNGKYRNHLTTTKADGETFTKDKKESEQLMAKETVQMEDLNKEKMEKLTPYNQQLAIRQEEQQRREELAIRQEEQQRREEAESRVKTLKRELETREKEVQKKQAELQQLHDQHQKKEKYLKDKLSEKMKEHETLKAQLEQWWFWSSSKEACRMKKMEVEREVETLKKLLETTETEFQTKIKKLSIKSSSSKMTFR
ncbi:butyrophilin subfamily 3 member A2-like [Channa argus]|uniref:butyrophilin subfamily 3 member A2-like n=1 Tax=Channa argus TaxID=215402 RepID=UPI00351FE25B